MSEASGRAEMERRIVQRSIEDEDFRRRLIEDPKGAVGQELGTRLPEEVRVVTVEETQDTIYLVLPSTLMAGAEGGALSDQQLEAVSGGEKLFPTIGGDTCDGGPTCNYGVCWGPGS
jgi:hypothetical protein